ncbi:MAG: ECF transporter S component [bacterium]|nr:ECF transporter S component [bacterium]
MIPTTSPALREELKKRVKFSSPYQTKVLPIILTFSQVKYYIFSVAFTSLAVFVPWFLHQFNLAGPKFLPMHFFILIAGFLFGWRTGIMVGILSPLMSYSISHMPPIFILPETILELAVYGFSIGLLREKKFNIWIALPLAMILGRLARLIFIVDFGLKTNFLAYLQMSWPGIVLQLILIPFIVFILQKIVFEKK